MFYLVAVALRLRSGRLSLEMVRRTISFALRTAPALLLALAPSLAMAQSAPRIKAVVVSFDGKLLTVKTSDPQSLQVALMPSTRIVRQVKRTLTDIKTGDYIGATIINAKDGSHHAQEVHLFPGSLRGSGEGLFAVDSTHFMIDGTVTSAAPNAIGLDFRGSGDENANPCTGRAPANGGCKGHADIAVAAGVPVTGLVDGDTTLLVPGAIVAVSILAGSDGHPVTPGLTVEDREAAPTPAAPAPAPAARPPAAH